MGIIAPTADERVGGVKITKDTLSVSFGDGRSATTGASPAEVTASIGRISMKT